jgi:pyruvate/2-oxoglutarate dehydrogenase complex dihydrolipoamide acyltransferase (E2) component
MGQPVVIEKWAENLEEVTLSEWLKAEGDPVAVGESLCVIITEKVTFEYECQTAGCLRKQYAPEGSTLPVGYVLAWIGAPGETPPRHILEENAGLMLEYRDRLKIDFNEGAEEGRECDSCQPAPVAEAEAAPVAASPAARRLARESGVALAEVLRFRGGSDRLSEADVAAYLESL